MWLPKKCDYRTDGRTDGQTDAGQKDPYEPLCFAGDTKRLLTKYCEIFKSLVVVGRGCLGHWSVKCVGQGHKPPRAISRAMSRWTVGASLVNVAPIGTVI